MRSDQQHYSVPDLAARWNLPVGKVQAIFRDEPGCIQFTPRCFRVPQEVADRVKERLDSGQTVPGFIYIVQPKGMPVVKVGFARRDWRSRIAGLQVALPIELKILLVVEGTHAEEQRLHSRLKQHRVRGEWFRVCPDIATCIEEKKANSIVSGCDELKVKPRKGQSCFCGSCLVCVQREYRRQRRAQGRDRFNPRANAETSA